MAVQVVGSLHLDVVVNAPRLPRLDETLTGQSVAYAFGGKGGNQAVAAARMGATVAMAGRVGADDFAVHLLRELDAAGVDHSGVQQDDGASGMSAAIVDAAGDYGAVIVSAANLRIDAQRVEINQETKILCLQNEIPEPVNLALARKARVANVLVILNAAPARDTQAELLELTDILVVNRGEAAELASDATPSEQARMLAARTGGSVVATLGAEGLVWAEPDGNAQALAAHPVTVVSTHGAGDAFVGALAAALDAGRALAQALRLAQAAAALHVATPVDQRRAITLAAVEQFAQTAQTGSP